MSAAAPLVSGSDGGTTYSGIVGYAVTINFIIGAGVLGLPYAFYMAGVPLTLITLGFFSFFLVLGCWWVLEILARAQGVGEAGVGDGDGDVQPVNRIVAFTKVSYTQFCGVFGGPAGKACAQLVVVCYCYGALWAYVATFSSSLAMVVFEFAVPTERCNIYRNPSAACQNTYYASVAFYALLVVPLSLMEITEQQVLQLVLTFYRFLAFALMLATVCVSLAVDGPMPSTAPPGEPSLWSLKWAGFGLMFPSAAVALCVHYNLPDALTPCRAKSHLRLIVTGAQLTALFFYVAIGALCAIHFNPPDPLITLNWQSFTGRGGGWGKGPARWWAVLIQMTIVLFPVIDLVNVFPLVVVTLSSNLTTFFHPTNKFWRFVPIIGASARGKHVFVRLLAAVLPLIAGATMGKLDKIFTVTGMFGFAIEFVIPTIFQYLSVRYMVARWGPGAAATPYSGWHSRPFWVFLELAVGIAAWVAAVVFTIITWTKGG
jgi:amino acid permease